MITTINEFKENKNIENLIYFIKNWLAGTEVFNKLKEDNESILKLIETWPEFSYTGTVYRVLGTEYTQQPIDLSTKHTSFSSKLVGIATLMDGWYYGGMLEIEADNLPIYESHCNNGFDINKAIKYIQKHKNIDEFDYYTEYYEIIGVYNNPKLKYIAYRNEESNKCGKSYAEIVFVDIKKWNNGSKDGKSLCSTMYA